MNLDDLVRETLESDIVTIIRYFMEKDIEVSEEAEELSYEEFGSYSGVGYTVEELLSVLKTLEPLKKRFPKGAFYKEKSARLLKVINNNYTLDEAYDGKSTATEMQQAMDWLRQTFG
jgi:hypothetical protein